MKKLILLLAALMVVTACLTAVHAEEITPGEAAVATFVNPYYDGELEVSTIQPRDNSIYTNDTYYRYTSDAARFVRGGLEERAEIIAVNMVITNLDESQFDAQVASYAVEILSDAFMHTTIPTQGDYLTWHYVGNEVYVDGYSEYSTYYLTFYIYNVYFTTAEEEAQVDAAVAALLPQLAGENDYEKVKATYDWVTDNVTCTPMDENSQLADFTAYGAIVNKSANSMGIANLMYRLLLELGIDTRIAYGTYNGNEQLWNIVCLMEEYYNIDAALDCGKTEDQFFLRCDANFGHVRDPQYDEEAYLQGYPMDDTDYVHGAVKVLDSGYCGKDGDEVYWKFTSDGTLTIYGNGRMIDYHAMYSSYAPWINRGEEIVQIVIEDGVTYIGSEAFSGLNSLSSVSIPESVSSMGEGVFRQCSALKSIILPDEITAIHNDTFRDCTSLSSVQLPEKLEIIGNDAFNGCPIETIIIPENVTSIGDRAFSQTALTEIVIPNSVTALGKSVFNRCAKLTKVTLSENLTEILRETFEGCTELADITLPDGITTLGLNAFNGCSSLKALTIPASVTNIEQSVFQMCHDMELTFIGDPPAFHEQALFNFSGTIYYPGTNENWTEDVLNTYCNNPISWVPYGLCEHAYTAVTTEPTCAEQGYTTYTCSECGDSYTEDYVDALGHSFADGTCTVCGASAFSMGDANGDGSINNIDAMLILQYAVSLNDGSNMNLDACDVNSDGSINNIDAMMVLQYAVGLIEVFPTE